MARVRLEVTSWNAEAILSRSDKILEAFAPLIAEEARRQLTEEKWVWPNATVRFRSLFQSGTPVKSKYGTGVRINAGPRDAVDTGTLLKSQQAPQVRNGVLSIEWTAPYAKNVQVGAYNAAYYGPLARKLQPAPGQKPARDWISAALVAKPLKPFFVTKWREMASGASGGKA
jgi:hypothetical protein